MSMNPRKGTVTMSNNIVATRTIFCQMSMNPRKGTVTKAMPRKPSWKREQSDEHESSEGDCDCVPAQKPKLRSDSSDEHESSEGDCDDVVRNHTRGTLRDLSDEHESSEGDCDRRREL